VCVCINRIGKICCSSGVTDTLAMQTRQTKLLTIPNGCDFPKYSQPTAPTGDWSALIADWHTSAHRLAVFAGNINYRLDFELIETLAIRYPEIGFIFVGPLNLSKFSSSQRNAWRRLNNKSNYRALGRVPAEDLPALYWRCDLGIIPYRTDLALLVENGFPLKALEMAAAGLPVVASLMKPLREVAAAVTVTADAEAFCHAVGAQSRLHRSEAESKAAEQICRAYDYDVLFGQMEQALGCIDSGSCRLADLGDFIERIGLDHYRDAVIRVGKSIRAPLWKFLLDRISPVVRQRVPEPIRHIVKRWLLH
jgi:glycosyltransferase involved in cell wall biosynthesis